MSAIFAGRTLTVVAVAADDPTTVVGFGKVIALRRRLPVVDTSSNSSAMLRVLVLATVGSALVITIALLYHHRRLVGVYAGRLALALGVLVLPALALLGSAGQAYKTSSSTTFCLECHEMHPYGASLFVDDPRSMPAVHYQKRLIDREETCFECHTDYAMFGDLKAKANGLRHVWVHFAGEVPEKLELYAPYPNYNCLHCHEDSRGFLEAPAHGEQIVAMLAGELSCLKCHGGHDLEKAAAGPYWEASR